MAKSVVVAVRDSAMGAFARPVFVPTIGVAIRSFTDEVNRDNPENQMFHHPDDHELWILAEFEDESGHFVPVEHKCLVRGKDVKNVA